MNDRDLKIVQKLKRLISQRAKIHDVRFFGSRARGDATDDSDLDVFIVMDELNHDIDYYISDCAWEAGFPEDVIVMPFAISLDDLKNSPMRSSIFIENVYREGIVV